jgi:tetratricopeptide (TPR) repeat protein
MNRVNVKEANLIIVSMKFQSKIFTSLAILIIIVIGCVAWAVLAPRYAEVKYREYIKLYQNGRLELALREINTAVFLDSKNADYYWSRALTYGLLFKEDPSNTDVLEHSRTDWQKAIRLKEGDQDWFGWGDVYFGLARAEYQLGRTNSCIVSFQDAFKHSADQIRKVRISSVLGYIYFMRGDYNNAVYWLSKVPEGDEVYYDSYLRNAIAHHRLNNLKNAEILYLRALTVRPNDGSLNIYIAHLYAELGERDKVIGYLKHGLEQLQDGGLVFATLGNDNFTSEPWSSTEYLKLYDSFFDSFQDELRSYATGDFAEDSLQIKKLNAFYRSINKVVVRSLDNPNPEVSNYAQTLLAKIKQAGLYKEKGVSQ